MPVADKIVYKSVIAPFYRQHAGAFLFLFFLLFGIQPSAADAIKTHYYIILSILTSTSILLVALLIWSLYALKTVLFFRDCLSKGSYDFIFLLNVFSPARKFIHLSRLQLSLLAPVLIYGVMIIAVAWKDRQLSNAIPVILVIAVLYFFTVAACYYMVENAKALQAVSRNPLPFVLPRKLFAFLIRFIFVKQFPALILLKLLSFFSLYLFSRVDVSLFEDRMLWLIYITSLVGHSVIIYRSFSFMERELRFYRNLPVKKFATWLSLLAVYCIILLPEVWALRGVAIVQHHTADYLWMVVSGPGLLLLLHSLLYTEDMKMEAFLQLLLGVWVVFIFFSLSSYHWIIPLTSFVFSLIIFNMSYRQYEKQAEVEGLE